MKQLNSRFEFLYNLDDSVLFKALENFLSKESRKQFNAARDIHGYIIVRGLSDVDELTIRIRAANYFSEPSIVLTEDMLYLYNVSGGKEVSCFESFSVYYNICRGLNRREIIDETIK
jgi:hypothetical protein